jgi:CAAX prenyl protease-like protein
MPERSGHGWWPYWVPFFGFLILSEVAGRFPESSQPFWLVAKAAIPGALFLLFALRGSYPEMRGFRATTGGIALDVLVGLGSAAIWMAPFLLVDSIRPAQPGFDPQVFGPTREWLAIGARGLGYVLVIPFVEEFFMRSWLPRFLDVWDKRRDFRDVPIAHFSWRSFLGVVALFVLSHAWWEAPVIALWAAGTMLWFYHRKHIVPLVIVHAVTNGSILLFVALADGRLLDGQGNPISLWFFV